MVGVSLRDGDAELLGQRRGLRAYVRDGKTMGIPLLYPWANRLAADRIEVGGEIVDLEASSLVGRDENGLPIHGLLAGWPGWRVEPIEPTKDPDAVAVSATLDFRADQQLMAAFPFPHRLRLEVGVSGRRLTVRTIVTANGPRAVPIAFGFHPYLRLPGVPREAWRIELPPMHRLELDGRGIPTGQSEPAPARSATLGSTALDDAFADVAPGAQLAVAAAGRRIVVGFDRGYPAAQVFAPATEDVICFEPMTAPTNALASGDRLRFVDPGETYVAQFSITVSSED